MIDEKKLRETLLNIQMGACMADDRRVVGEMNRFMRILDDEPTVPDTNVGKWIPVTERLPEPNEIVIVTVIDQYNKEYFTATDNITDDGTWFEYDGEYNECVVLYWMELPKPYEEES